MRGLHLTGLALTGLAFLSSAAALPARADNIGPVRKNAAVAHFGEDGKKSREEIRGHCTILEGNGNPFTASCTNFMLRLIDHDDKTERQDRTTQDGYFAFLAEKGHWYQVAPASKAYQVVSPSAKHLLKGGDGFELKLKQL